MLIAANWKMNGTLDQLQSWMAGLKNDVGHDLVLFPPYHLLSAIKENDFFSFGGQDFYPKDAGALTGAVSGVMLQGVGAQWAIVGHSERRELFGDDNDIVHQKYHYAHSVGLKPILCVGESLETRQNHSAETFVVDQIKSALKNLPKQEDPLIIAYEPIWAIGSGLVPDDDAIERMHTVIHQYVTEQGFHVKVLYGGSVKPSNVAALSSIPYVDGFLVGGASLQIKDFNEVIRLCKMSSHSST